jgi:hypothetical protein
MNRRDKIVSAVGATLAAGAIGAIGAGVARRKRPADAGPAACTDGGGGTGTRGQRRMCWGVDTDNIQEGDQNGPEEPDDCAPCTARTLRMLL